MNLQTNLLEQTVYLKNDRYKTKYKVTTVFIENGCKLVISDQHGGLKTVTVEEVDIYVPVSF